MLKEDSVAILSGVFILLLGLIAFSWMSKDEFANYRQEMNQLMERESSAPYKTMVWLDARDKKKTIKEENALSKFLKKITTKPTTWSANPIDAFYKNEEQINFGKTALNDKYQSTKQNFDNAKTTARKAEEKARASNFENEAFNEKAVASINQWQNEKKSFDKIEKKYKAKTYNKWPWLLGLFLFLGILFGAGVGAKGGSMIHFLKGFGFVFAIALIAYLLGAQADMKAIGFGYAAWAILIGLLISNTIGTPSWAKPALATELFIKTGLVILGAEILFGKVLAIGLPGIFVAWIVTPIVLVSTFWFGQKILKIESRTLNATISADMSVCGVSAAVAVAAACKATKEELTIAIGLSMIFTSVMMIAMPAVIKAVGMPEVLGGAWMGGTIDATGAVVAAGAFLGEKALSVAATIKMIQNILIGVIAFAVAVYFARTSEGKDAEQNIGWGEIWKRFPKFILGFIGASIVFSLLYEWMGADVAYTEIEKGVIGSFTKNVRGWLFCLAFVSIGLSIRFKELRQHFVGGKPLILYICGQALNLTLTLLMAYLMFYKVFPYITENI